MEKQFKKYLPSTQSLQNSFPLKHLKTFFTDPRLWSRDTQGIARGVAAGLAGAVIPGFQVFYAAIIVYFLKGNLPIALLCTLITNPLTLVPITYFVYFIGASIIGNGKTYFVIQDFRWDFSSFHAFWSNLTAWILQFGKAFLVGLPIVTLCLGIIGYFGTILIWEAFILLSNKKRK